MTAAAESAGATRPQRLGAWAFRQRSWLPVPLALALVFVRWHESRAHWVVPAGALLAVAGLTVRAWGVRHIGTISRTRATRQGPLITSGPYTFVRNPLYVGNWLLWTGFVLLSALVWMLPVAWVVFGVQYGAIAAWEESRLRNHYGAAFDEYAAAVPRWLPMVTGWTPRNPPERHPWSGVAFSERGTLIAAAAMSVLLVIKLTLR